MSSTSANFISILKQIAAGNIKINKLLNRIESTNIEPNELIKLLSLIKNQYKEREYKYASHRLCQKFVSKEYKIDFRKIMLLLPQNNYIWGKLAENSIYNERDSDHEIKEIFPQTFYQKLWTQRLANALFKSSYNRVHNEALEIKYRVKLMKPEQASSPDGNEIFQMYSDLQSLKKKLGSKALIDMALNLHTNQHYDFLLELAEFKDEKLVEQLVNGAVLRNVNIIDPSHWIWGRILQSNLANNQIICSDLSIFILSLMKKGNFEQAAIFYYAQVYHNGKGITASDWWKMIYKN